MINQSYEVKSRGEDDLSTSSHSESLTTTSSTKKTPSTSQRSSDASSDSHEQSPLSLARHKSETGIENRRLSGNEGIELNEITFHFISFYLILSRFNSFLFILSHPNSFLFRRSTN
jgi:hypothetical protein